MRLFDRMFFYSPSIGGSLKLATIVALIGVAVTGLVHAHGNATGIVKERMDMMERLGEASKAIGQMIKNSTTYSGDVMTEHAQTINGHSKEIVEYFPPGSVDEASEALPVIWDRWAHFVELAEGLEASSEALADAARSGDRKAVRARFARVAKSCKGCHQDFRKKKD